MVVVSIFRWLLNLRWKEKNENIQIWSRYSLFKNTGCSLPASSSAALRHFYRDHHHHHHHHHLHHYCSLYLRNDQNIWITTKIHIFTKGFKHIECGHFLRDLAGFHEHNEPKVVLYTLWHDIINSHKVTKHACTFSCLPLATQYTTYTITLQ